MTIRFLVDTSAMNRVARSPEVATGLRRASQEGLLVICPPVLLELGFSARSLDDWDRLQADLADFPVLHPSPLTQPKATSLQRALWAGGKVRAVGAFDTFIAAIAMEHRATVLHYDRDFEHLGSVEPRFDHRWVAPAGSVA